MWARLRSSLTKFRLARRPAPRRVSDRGVALVVTLLLLSLMSVVGLAMVLSMSSDMLINGYYRNYRGAFYAADSGLSVARQQLVQQIVGAVPAVFATPPLAANAASTVQNYITNNYGTGGQGYISLNTGQAASSWGGNFEITNVSFSQTSCTVTASGSTPPGTCALDGKATAYQYIYSYSITSSGRALASQLTTVQENGNITLNVTGAPATENFAAWGMFIDQQPICSGSYLVPGTITGPVFTNGAWTFGTTGSYIFTDPVGSAGAKAGWQFGSCYQSNAGSYTSGGQQIKPNFQSGYNWGQGAVPLPANDFSQKYAAIDGLGTGEAIPNPTPAQWHTILNGAVKNISGAAYPVGGAASGVYLPYSSVSGTNTITGGGIYVEGDASSVQLSTGTDASGHPTQVFSITQGATTTTVTTNVAANSTTVKSGGTTLILAGVPQNLNTSPATAATMLYVDGNIGNSNGTGNGLSGPGPGLPAVQDGSQVTVTAENNITVTGDVLYKTEPVTFTQNQIPGTPADTLIPGNNNGQALGIYTATGNIDLNNKQASTNLEIDASMASISSGGSGGLVNTGAAIGTLTIVGGRIQNTIQNINSTTRNVFFDRRFAAGSGFAPPWFPSTTLAGPSVSHTTVSSVQPVSWITTPQ